MPALKAAEQLERIEAASVPHMKADAHRSVVDRLFARLGANAPRPRRATLADLQRMGVNVRVKPKQAKGGSG